LKAHAREGCFRIQIAVFFHKAKTIPPLTRFGHQPLVGLVMFEESKSGLWCGFGISD
jgi:hypothetical protein